MKVAKLQTEVKEAQKRKIDSLEEFIFNVATIFLNPTELYYFKIFVLANRAFIDIDERNLEFNNVYNHSTIENYIKFGITSRSEMLRLDQEAKAMQATETEKFIVNEHVLSLFNQGFIVRYAKYDSARIQYKTPLTFKANNFVDQFNEQLTRLHNALKSENEAKRRQQASKFQCLSTACAKAKLTDENENYILRELKHCDLYQINCPLCNRQGFLQKNKSSEIQIDKTAAQAEEVIKELAEQAQRLHKITEDDEDYLERELRAMRAVFNEKIQLKRKIVTKTQKEYDRRLIFSQRSKSLQDQEQQKKARLEAASLGIDTTSIYKFRGPVFKAPRHYQSGLVGAQKPEWLADVYARAEEVLKKE